MAIQVIKTPNGGNIKPKQPTTPSSGATTPRPTVNSAGQSRVASNLYNELKNRVDDPNALRKALGSTAGVSELGKFSAQYNYGNPISNPKTGPNNSGGSSSRPRSGSIYNYGSGTTTAWQAGGSSGGSAISSIEAAEARRIAEQKAAEEKARLEQAEREKQAGIMLDDYLAKVRGILDEEKKYKTDKANSNYEALIATANNNYDDARNAITRNNAYTNRWLQQTYGNGISGTGLSNQLRANTVMNNNLNSAMRDRNAAYLSAETARNEAYAGATGDYARNYSNLAQQLNSAKLGTDLQAYQNDLNRIMQKYQIDSNANLSRYGADLEAKTKAELNQQDLDYRKYLAALGLL